MLLHGDNSAARGGVNRETINLRGVPRRRRELTEEEKADARRLRETWLRQKNQLGFNSQEEFAVESGLGTTQGAFNHYLNEKQPLNLEAAIKIARALKVDVAEISPRLAALLAAQRKDIKEHVPPYTPPAEPNQDPELLTWMRLYHRFKERGLIRPIIRMLHAVATKSSGGRGNRDGTPASGARAKKPARAK